MNQENQLRVPRPAGVTMLSQNYQTIRSDENLDRLYSHIISIYTLEGFRWNKQPRSISQMAQILKIPVSTIMQYISKVSLNMGSLADPEQLDQTLKSIITLSTSWAIQDRGIIQNQLDTLMRSQGGRYMPFVSSEVNKALKLILESNKNLMESYKTFFTQSSTTINILNMNANKGKQEHLTHEDAINIIQSNNKEVRAIEQGMVDWEGSPSGLVDPQELTDIYQAQRIGDLESVLEKGTGTAALRPPSPVSFKASEPVDSPHNAVSQRRAEEPYDDEVLPNRASR